MRHAIDDDVVGHRLTEKGSTQLDQLGCDIAMLVVENAHDGIRHLFFSTNNEPDQLLSVSAHTCSPKYQGI